ncbi:hypothetical protein SCACP_23390 [Sporomusa carbonis]|uniref:hypothetical protein n=1 Tax=Sporomusa carbonis TaxID=3076075 RepID=UPI003A62E28D
MALKPDKKPPNIGRSRDGTANDRAEVRYFKGEEQFERWRKEFIQHRAYELKLAAISKLSYDLVDYQALLTREPFPDLKLTDYSYLVDEAKTKAEAKYFYPVAGKIAVIIGLLGILAILFSPSVLLITAALGVATAVSLFFTMKDRDNAITQAEQDALAEIARRNEQERLAFEEARRQHEEQENSRIIFIEQLLAGEPGAVRSRLDYALNQLKLPVVVEVDIDFYGNIFFVKVWLPPKTVVPRQACELLASGRIQYQDKDARVFNKQYFELCVAIVLQIMSTIFANIPSFQEGYAAGMVKSEFSDDCVISLKIPREKIDNVCRASNAIAAMQAFDAVYECDTALVLYPIDMLQPPEWEGLEPQLIKSLRVRIFK